MASLSKGSTVLAVFCGGALGALMRAMVMAVAPPEWNASGGALLLVNLVGAFALGVLSVFFARRAAGTHPAAKGQTATHARPATNGHAVENTRPATNGHTVENTHPTTSGHTAASGHAVENTHPTAKPFLTTGFLGAFTSFASLSSTSWMLLEIHPQHESLRSLSSTPGAVGQMYSHLDDLSAGGSALGSVTFGSVTFGPVAFVPLVYAVVMMFGSIVVGLVAAWCGIALGHALWGAPSTGTASTTPLSTDTALGNSVPTSPTPTIPASTIPASTDAAGHTPKDGEHA